MDLIALFESKDTEQLSKGLKDFVIKNANTFVIPDLDTASKQKLLWTEAVATLQNDSFEKCHLKTLELLKILSRNNQHLDSIINMDILHTLLWSASLQLQTKSCSKSSDVEKNINILESLKCLYNLILSHDNSRNLLAKSSMAEAILERISHKPVNSENFGILLFDLKILFVLTAKCEETRVPLRRTLGGLPCLAKFLENIMAKNVSNLNDDEIDLSIEVLRIVFNLLLSNNPTEMDSNKPDLDLQSMVVKAICPILSMDSKSSAKRDELKSQAVNLLLIVDPECYGILIPPSVDEETSYLEHDVSSMVSLLDFMESRLTEPNRTLEEKLVPIISVLIRCSRSHRIIRKYLRVTILPPLKDVSRRPEEGDALRNKLCRLMTSPITQVEYMVAEFLFLLCKENVGRLIKYTGYGNAAGLLANRGLMMGRSADYVSTFSSDSDTSDTEEYRRVEQNINPVTGAYEPKRANPVEHMSDEQKEYEANKLISMIDQLHRQGIIQPATIGEDGKPRPIEHVLELQRDLSK